MVEADRLAHASQRWLLFLRIRRLGYARSCALARNTGDQQDRRRSVGDFLRAVRRDRRSRHRRASLRRLGSRPWDLDQLAAFILSIPSEGLAYADERVSDRVPLISGGRNHETLWSDVVDSGSDWNRL